MHHPTDRITHTTAFVTKVVEHWLEREIAQWVHPMKDRSDDPSHYAGTTQDNFILPAPPVGRLPISQDWLDRMKLLRNRTIPIILPSGKNILVDTMFKIIIGYTNLGMRQIQCRLGSRICPFITSNAKMAGYPRKNKVFLAKLFLKHLYHHPNQGMFQLHRL